MKQMSCRWILAMGVAAGCGPSSSGPGQSAALNPCGSPGPDGGMPDAANTSALAFDGASDAADDGSQSDGNSTVDGSTSDVGSRGDWASTDGPQGDATDYGTGFPFQPSNVDLAVIAQYASAAQAVTVSADCTITTDLTDPGSNCPNTSFSPGIAPVVVQQKDPATGQASTINLVVVSSLSVQGAAIHVNGTAPLVIVSLHDVTLSAGASILANTTLMYLGAGGGPGGGPGASGGGVGRGLPAMGLAGGGGGSYCGVGGAGGGGSTSTAYGVADLRPLLGGSGGGGLGPGVPSELGGGGGALQIVAAGAMNIASGTFITASGQGGGGYANGACLEKGAGVPGVFGAGGGGSGGAILLEGASVFVAGALVANGGGGGGLAVETPPDGQDGWFAPPLSSASTLAAGSDVGGAGSAGTTIGGGTGQTVACPTDSTSTAAGGGGGGAGFIRINSKMVSIAQAIISPSMTTSCAGAHASRALGTGP